MRASTRSSTRSSWPRWTSRPASAPRRTWSGPTTATPLFLTAGAIVVEEGGSLSHAAIIARELKLPAVLNVPGLLARLAGAESPTMRLRVDGDRGTIEILDDVRMPGPQPEPVVAS